MKARVLVYPRREVLDPQAKAIHQALARLGFDDVVEVHAGKAFEIVVSGRTATAEQRLRAMCDALLANPIMERYTIELLPAAAKPPRTAPKSAPAKSAPAKSTATKSASGKMATAKGATAKSPAAKKATPKSPAAVKAGDKKATAKSATAAKAGDKKGTRK